MHAAPPSTRASSMAKRGACASPQCPSLKSKFASCCLQNAGKTTKMQGPPSVVRESAKTSAGGAAGERRCCGVAVRAFRKFGVGICKTGVLSPLDLQS